MLLIAEIYVICRLQWWVTVLNLPPVSTAHSGLYCLIPTSAWECG